MVVIERLHDSFVFHSVHDEIFHCHPLLLVRLFVIGVGRMLLPLSLSVAVVSYLLSVHYYAMPPTYHHCKCFDCSVFFCCQPCCSCSCAFHVSHASPVPSIASCLIAFCACHECLCACDVLISRLARLDTLLQCCLPVPAALLNGCHPLLGCSQMCC